MTQLACVSKHVLGTKVKTEQMTERIYKSEYSAEIGLAPSRTLEKRASEGLGVEVKHLGPLSEEIAACLASSGSPPYDPENPRHIFLFELSNESEELRKFTPYMDFGHKGLEKKASLSMIGSGEDLCSVVLSYLPINEVSVVSGERKVLQCGAPQGGGVASFVNDAGNDNKGPRSFDLFPKQQRRGILIATQPANTDAAVNAPDSVDGKFMLYVHPTSGGLTSKLLNIPYSFSRTKTEVRIPYDRISKRGYTVEEIQKVFNLLLVLPMASGNPYEERMPGSEVDLGSEDVRAVE